MIVIETDAVCDEILQAVDDGTYHYRNWRLTNGIECAMVLGGDETEKVAPGLSASIWGHMKTAVGKPFVRVRGIA